VGNTSLKEQSPEDVSDCLDFALHLDVEILIVGNNQRSPKSYLIPFQALIEEGGIVSVQIIQNIQHTLIIVYASNIDGLRNVLADFFQCLSEPIRDIRVIDRCLELGSRIIL